MKTFDTLQRYLMQLLIYAIRCARQVVQVSMKMVQNAPIVMEGICMLLGRPTYELFFTTFLSLFEFKIKIVHSTMW